MKHTNPIHVGDEVTVDGMEGTFTVEHVGIIGVRLSKTVTHDGVKTSTMFRAWRTSVRHA